MTTRKSFVRGVGAYLPERIMTNEEMSTVVDTSDEWITARTGIRQRHIAAEGEFTSDIATAAARDALRHAGVDVDEVDLVYRRHHNTRSHVSCHRDTGSGEIGYDTRCRLRCAGRVLGIRFCPLDG